ncbi:ubiquinone/menaquinone biosynthesis C-methyltransferase UbiE-like [Rhopilema esculentum]|uniref:ubiquinone/menaquinone biosynthesis C-methyltransferase UbiE-like n=1 Tax=Rhopilema esculentum TaxID=499914 RepID=UPI0031D0F94D|eukprot:gene875-10625_t
MSNFEKYDSTSAHYDDGRVPAGASVYAAVIQNYLNKPLNEIHLLDAGCGTGNYSKAFLDNGIGKVSCFDASEGMLSKAKNKLSDYIATKNVIQIKQGFLPKIPYEDNCYDAVIFMQVLHHIDTLESNFANLKATMKDAYRVLKPGGVLMINFCTGDQVLYGAWFVNLIPRSAAIYRKRYMPQEDLLDCLESIGFESPTTVTRPNDTILTKEKYFRKDGPLDPEWRQMDSIWRNAEIENEVEEATKALQEKFDNNTFDAWFAEVEKKRKSIGITTSIFVQKPSA